MAIYKHCPKCGKVISINEKYCSSCKEVVDNNNKKKYSNYNKKRYSDLEERKYVKFYSSSEWIKIRDYIKIRDCGLCIPCFYSLCTSGNVIYKDEDTCASEYSHHIEELKECWNKRIDDMNLISVCSCHHDTIHREYNKGIKEKEQMQKALREILDWYLKNFCF